MSRYSCGVMKLTKAQEDVKTTLQKRAAILEHMHYNGKYRLSYVDGGFTPVSYPRTSTIDPMMKAGIFKILHDQSNNEKTTYVLKDA